MALVSEVAFIKRHFIDTQTLGKNVNQLNSQLVLNYSQAVN
jgi:hypothetical protein